MPMIQLLALLLTVPPVPHPPADRYAAAEKLLHVAPLPAGVKTHLRERAVSSYANSVMPRRTPEDYDRRRDVERRINRRLADDGGFDADFGRCLVDAVGWKYELSMLNDIAVALTTAGGKLLWAEAMIPTAETCLRETMPTFLQTTGFASAIRWFAINRQGRTLPTYEAATPDPDRLSADLVAYCGASTRDALAVRDSKLGIVDAWAGKRRNSGAVACLVHGATLAGYDLPVLQADGSTVKLIIAS